MPPTRSTGRLRIAIIGCGPANQEPMTYLGAKWTVRGLLGRKIQDFAARQGYTIEPHLYWPTGNPGDYPIPGTYDAVIIPGSRLNIDDDGLSENTWMDGLLEFIRCIEPEVPVLGICFGHQAIAVAHGGRVEKIPKPIHVEVGFSPVYMTGDGKGDEIFRDIPGTFEGLFSHSTYVAKPPAMSKTLAYGVMEDMVQAYRVGHSTWGVQFHPDYSPDNIGELVQYRKAKLANLLDISQIKTINEAGPESKVRKRKSKADATAEAA